MDSNDRTFAPIARGPSRTVARNNSRSSSRSRRSLGLNTSPSISRVYSAQAFDDHYGVYSPPPSPEAARSKPHALDSDDAASTTSESDHEKQDRDLEKQETEELPEAEVEVQYGVENERDFESKGEALSRRATGQSLERDPTVVDWESPDDPENPKNWSMKKKWAATFIVSVFTFISPVSSSMVAPALDRLSEDLGIHNQVESALALSIFLLAYAIGPLFLGPLSEVYGRVRVIQFANLFFLAWNTGCGFAQSPGQLFAFRFLAGLGGSAPLAIGGGILSDTWTADQRGKAISIYSLMPLLGKFSDL